jgi:hypothetical protein
VRDHAAELEAIIARLTQERERLLEAYSNVRVKRNQYHRERDEAIKARDAAQATKKALHGVVADRTSEADAARERVSSLTEAARNVITEWGTDDEDWIRPTFEGALAQLRCAVEGTGTPAANPPALGGQDVDPALLKSGCSQFADVDAHPGICATCGGGPERYENCVERGGQDVDTDTRTESGDSGLTKE